MRTDRESVDFGGDRVIDGDEEQGGTGNPATRKIRGGIPGLPHGFSGRAGAGAADAGVGIESEDADRDDQRRPEAGGSVRGIRGGCEFFPVQAGGQGATTEIGVRDDGVHRERNAANEASGAEGESEYPVLRAGNRGRDNKREHGGDADSRAENGTAWIVGRGVPANEQNGEANCRSGLGGARARAGRNGDSPGAADAG